MIELNVSEVEQVSGGFLQLIAAVVAVFVFPKIINDTRKEYNEWGHQIGETLYEYNHPYDPNH
jgi:hypothetical protein